MFLFRSTIRDKIIPHAVSWFTGEAIEEDEFEGLEDDDEEDEGGEEEDEDEDEDDDEEEEDSKTKKKVCCKLIWSVETFWFILRFEPELMHLFLPCHLLSISFGMLLQSSAKVRYLDFVI